MGPISIDNIYYTQQVADPEATQGGGDFQKLNYLF